MNVWNRFLGMVLVETVSAAPEEMLAAVNAASIPVYSLQRVDDLTLRFYIPSGDYTRLHSLLERKGDRLRLVRRRGLLLPFLQLGKRPVLLTGILLLMLLSWYLPTRVLFVQVQGNETIPARQILASAEKCGIRFFASRREVRSEKVKNALLLEIPQLQWAGINTQGCTAILSVREKKPTETQENTKSIGNLVALRDGLVDSVLLSRGTALCSPGQVVKRGQTLISGYTDCGICIRATGAEGEVYALTNHEFKAVTPLNYQITVSQTAHHRNISLLLGKNRINLWKDSGIWDTTCGRMYEEYYITLPGGFSLPLGIAVETYTGSTTAQQPVPLEMTENLLSDFSRNYLKENMIAGQILNSTESISQIQDMAVLQGAYLCREMIGRIQWEQIGE